MSDRIAWIASWSEPSQFAYGIKDIFSIWKLSMQPMQIQSNLNGSNIFGTMEIYSRLCHWPLLLCKYLWSETNLIGIPSRIIWGKLIKWFKVNRMASVFKALKDMSHCSAQADRICKSWLIIPCKSIIDNAAQKREIAQKASVSNLKMSFRSSIR